MKNLSKLYSLALFLLVIGASSCFDIVEEYHFNADGSGSAKFTVDVSEMMGMMSMLAESVDSSGEGAKSIEDMFGENESIKLLKQIPGVSNVKNLSSKENGMVGYSYDFENLEALNTALAASNDNPASALGGGMSGLGGMEMTEGNENFFEQNGKKFSRVFNIEMPESENGEEEQYMEMAMAMFAEAEYTTRYSFEQRVKKVKKNDLAVIGPDGKSVKITTSMADFLKGKNNLNAQIKLK